MSDLPDEFHDPALRSAIQRAEGKPVAPAPLREKVAALLAASGAADLAPQKNRRRAWEMPKPSFGFVGLAAAALLAVGWAGMQIYDFVNDGRPFPIAHAAPITVSFAQTIVRSHNSFANLPDHHVLPGNDLQALQAPLSSGAGVTAFSAALGDDWKFQGAGVVPVGDAKAAEVLFSRGDETASVISMIMAGGDCETSECFVQMVDHRAVAATSRHGSLYAVVLSQSGAGDPPLAAATSLLKTVETRIYGASSTCATIQPTAAAAPPATPAAK